MPDHAPASIRACIALGSNLGDRRANIDAAIAALRGRDGITVTGVSDLIETEPVGPEGQGPYLNGAVTLETTRSARELIDLMLRIEREVGRDRSADAIRWGPRVIDLDLLLYGDEIIVEAGLTVPHPRMHERFFVLSPLHSIAPEAVHPVLDQTVAELLRALERRVER